MRLSQLRKTGRSELPCGCPQIVFTLVAELSGVLSETPAKISHCSVGALVGLRRRRLGGLVGE